MSTGLLRPPRRPGFLSRSGISVTPTTACLQTHSRALHTTPLCLQTHYDTLALSPSAPASSVKKSFYALSKKYHPDLNRGPDSDPEAAEEKFVAISEAYSILGNPKKREKYDRDIIGTGQIPAHTAGARGAASGFGGAASGGAGAGGQAGGRAPSGLSRRRGQFTGPPPSFYRAGGWGTSGEKRKEHQYKDPAFHGSSASGQGSATSNGQQGPDGGFEGEDSPFLDPNDVPHFDRAGHYRKGVGVEEQLRQGRKRRIWARSDGSVGKTGSTNVFSGGDAGEGMKNFLGIGSVLGLALSLPFFVYGAWRY